MNNNPENTYDSDDSEFLEIKLQPPNVEKLACFCEGGNACLIHHGDE